MWLHIELAFFNGLVKGVPISVSLTFPIVVVLLAMKVNIIAFYLSLLRVDNGVCIKLMIIDAPPQCV